MEVLIVAVGSLLAAAAIAAMLHGFLLPKAVYKKGNKKEHTSERKYSIPLLAGIHQKNTHVRQPTVAGTVAGKLPVSGKLPITGTSSVDHFWPAISLSFHLSYPSLFYAS